MDEFLEAVHKAFNAGLDVSEMIDIIEMVASEKEDEARTDNLIAQAEDYREQMDEDGKA